MKNLNLKIKGASLVEYGALTGLISVLAIGAVIGFGEETRSGFETAQHALSSNIATPNDAASSSEDEEQMEGDFGWVYLGAVPFDLDPIEGNEVTENDMALQGFSFGDALSPLSSNVSQATMYDLKDDPTDGTLSANNLPVGDEFETDIGSGIERFTFDSVASYGGTIITYDDDTTAVVDAVVVQSTDGSLFLAPPSSSGPNAAAYEARAIKSLDIGSCISCGSGTPANLTINRHNTAWATP